MIQWKRLIVSLLTLGFVLVVICMIPVDKASGTRVGDVIVNKIITPPEGYSLTEVKDLVNNTDLGGASSYTTFTPSTGTFFERIQIYAVKAGAAQFCSLRVWASTTDSSMISTNDNGYDAFPMNWGSGESGLVGDFPLRCVKVSFDAIASIDDIYVVGYTRNY